MGSYRLEHIYQNASLMLNFLGSRGSSSARAEMADAVKQIIRMFTKSALKKMKMFILLDLHTSKPKKHIKNRLDPNIAHPFARNRKGQITRTHAVDAAKGLSAVGIDKDGGGDS